jgi:hypothetical protein
VHPHAHALQHAPRLVALHATSADLQVLTPHACEHLVLLAPKVGTPEDHLHGISPGIDALQEREGGKKDGREVREGETVHRKLQASVEAAKKKLLRQEKCS